MHHQKLSSKKEKENINMNHQKYKRNGSTSKSKKMKKAAETSAISMLPEDVIVEVIAQVVSSSHFPFVDLYSLKNTCKTFFALSKDNIVKQRISLERGFSNLNWIATDHRMDILNSCANAENAEAYFILALISIFEQEDSSKGIELLRKAISKGHKASIYLMNILHLRLREHTLSDGVFSLDNDDQFELCREKILNMVRQVTWKKWQATGTRNKKWCKSVSCGIPRGWNDHRNFCSDACRWNYEHNALCKRL